MNILVCVKQVPDTTEIKIDPVTNTLIRDGVESILNPFDGYAVELGLRIKDQKDAKVVVMSMGPPQAKAALRECLAIGADNAYLVSDRAFGGSDTLATSYILSCAVKAVEKEEGPFDVILCGKQAIDGDTAQVGPEMAEQLGYPQITFVNDLYYVDNKVRGERETENGVEVWETNTPAVVTATKLPDEPRYPTVKSRLSSIRADIKVLAIGDIDADASRSGLKGSPTKVKRTYVPQLKAGGVMINEDSSKASAAKLAVKLSDIGLI